MKMRNVINISVLFALCLTVVRCAATADESGKIPITTSSAEAKASYLEGRDLLERLRFADARSKFEAAVTEDPEFALGHLHVALTAPSAKVFFASLAKASELADNASEAERLWIKGQESGANGDPHTQGKLWQTLAEKYPNDERAQNILGGYYFGQQEWAKAIGEYEKALAINADFSPPYNQLGYAYRFLNQYDKAEETFRKYIALIPNDPNPYDSYAELLLKRGKYEESIRNYKKALEQDPKFVASYLGIASNRNYMADHAGARATLDDMYRNAVDDGQRRAAHFAKAISYVFEGDQEKALAQVGKMYEIAMKIHDESAMAADLGTMANILLQFGQPDAAMAKYNQSIEIMRKSALSEDQKQLAERFHLANLAQVAIGKGDYKTAKEHAGKFATAAAAAQNVFQVRFAHEIAGRIALAEKDFDKALEELRQANQQNPYNLYRIALAYHGSGDEIKAQEWRTMAKDFNPVNNLNQAFVHVHSTRVMSAK